MTQSKWVSLEDLCKGTPSCFVRVHTHAFASLIFGDQAITDKTAPETLLFDVRRLSYWQREAYYITDSCAALVILTQYLKGRTAVDVVAVSDVLKHFTDVFLVGDYDFSQLSSDLCTKLDCKGLLLGTGDEQSKDRINILSKLSVSIGKPEDAVHKLL